MEGVSPKRLMTDYELALLQAGHANVPWAEVLKYILSFSVSHILLFSFSSFLTICPFLPSLFLSPRFRSHPSNFSSLLLVFFSPSFLLPFSSSFFFFLSFSYFNYFLPYLLHFPPPSSSVVSLLYLFYMHINCLFLSPVSVFLIFLSLLLILPLSHFESSRTYVF